jgi:hypothetical protein
MITCERSRITLAGPLTIRFPHTHAVAVDNQAEGSKARPAAPDVDVALLAAVDTLAFSAVLALNEAHGMLVKAGVATRSPPSDQWYRLIEQLTAPRRLAGEGVMPPRAGRDAVDLKQRERRLCVGAAAFLAAEAHHLEDHCAALSDDAGQTAVRDRLGDIADQVRAAADALLKHAEHLNELIPSYPGRPRTSSTRSPLMSRSRPEPGARGSSWPTSTRTPTNVGSRGRSASPWFLTAALSVVYGGLGHFITAFSHQTLVIVFLFAVGPGVVVLRWHSQARHPHHFINFLRTPRRGAEWSDEITRQSDLLDARATALRDLLRRIHLVAGDVAAERRVCENHGLVTAASKLDSLRRLLQDASESAENLAELVTAGNEEARRFTASCRRDPREACSEYGWLPLLLNPERIGAVIDSLVLVLRLTSEVAVDIPLHIQSKESRISTVPAGKIATAVESIFREVLGSRRSVKHECRSMLRTFDLLHRLVTTESIAALQLGLASRTTARAAVAATVLAQPRARRPAVRTAFVREASVSSGRSWVWIGKATAAAITRGQKSLVQ